MLKCPECGSTKIYIYGKIINVMFAANSIWGEGEFKTSVVVPGTPFVHNDSTAKCGKCGHNSVVFFFNMNIPEE